MKTLLITLLTLLLSTNISYSKDTETEIQMTKVPTTANCSILLSEKEHISLSARLRQNYKELPLFNSNTVFAFNKDNTQSITYSIVLYVNPVKESYTLLEFQTITNLITKKKKKRECIRLVGLYSHENFTDSINLLTELLEDNKSIFDIPNDSELN